MCGIIGYVGSRASKPLLIQGLERLEYRGYDSAGIALLEEHGIDYTRAVGNLQNLKAKTGLERLAVDDRSRPHPLGHARRRHRGERAPARGVRGREALDRAERDRRELPRAARRPPRGGPHVPVGDRRRGGRAPARGRLRRRPRRSRARAYARLEGHFTFVVIHHDQPNHLVGVRHQTPMVVGLGKGENFLASNLAAFLAETRRVQFPDDGEIVSIRPDAVAIIDATTGAPVEHDVIEVDWDDDAAERSGYETFMLKEIYEQPEGVAETIGDRVRHGHLVLDGLGMTEEELRDLRRIVIVACGTAYHAGVVGRYAIEEWARVPVEPDVASEWIYRNPVVDPGTLVIGISQSGETRDTIQAMKLAREKARAPSRSRT